MLSSTLSKINIMKIFKTNTNIMNILRHNNSITPLEKKTGVYKLSCDDCDCFYIGQTGRGFLKRFNEHTPKHNLKKLCLFCSEPASEELE